MADGPGAISTRPLNGKQLIARFLKRVVLCLLAAAAVAYAIDFLIVRARIAMKGAVFGTVTVRPYYAVPQKDKKTEFIFDDPQDQTCVHALFPQAGDMPCWYLARHQEKRIDM